MELHRFGHNAFAPETKRGARGEFQYVIGDKMPDADIYVLQQRPEPIWLKLIPQLQALGKVVVAETDDYYAGIPPGHVNWHNIRPHIKPLHRIYSMADAMTVSTPFLKRAYSKLNPNIHVVPNYLDWNMWENLPPKNWERVRIGWMGEAKYRPDDLAVLKGIIGPFLRRHPEVDFVAAGDPQVHELLDVPEDQRVSYERVLFEDLPSITATMDVGLVPLAGHDFNNAKSHLKGMEYAACGIPCIASPSESYRQWVEEGVNGFTARRPKDWLRHLDRLVSDEGLRRRMGEAAKAKARANTIQENAWRWNQVFEQLAGSRHQRLARQAISRKALQKPSELAAFLEYLDGKTVRTVVEIGTAQGGTLGALCQTAADDALVVSVDLPGGDQDETSEADKYGQRDTSRMAAYRQPRQHLEFLQLDSHHPATRATLERLLDGRTIDLLFIDGDHSYRGVKQDFEMYVPLLSPEGLVAFHDILPHEVGLAPGVEVDRFWNELKASYRTREFVNASVGEQRGWGAWGGIGVVENAGQKIPQLEAA
jgi:glycosyltransferase involved in cell wall biosynthesis